SDGSPGWEAAGPQGLGGGWQTKRRTGGSIQFRPLTAEEPAMRRTLRMFLCVVAWSGDNALTQTPLRAQSNLPPLLRDFGFDQRLNEQVPLDLVFKDETGQSLQLGAYFHTKPVILVLAYYRCPMLCTEVLNGLVRALLEIPFDVGKEFNVVTVSFDARETP